MSRGDPQKARSARRVAARAVTDCKLMAPEPKLLSGHDELEQVTAYSCAVPGPKQPKM